MKKQTMQKYNYKTDRKEENSYHDSYILNTFPQLVDFRNHSSLQGELSCHQETSHRRLMVSALL